MVTPGGTEQTLNDSDWGKEGVATEKKERDTRARPLSGWIRDGSAEMGWRVAACRAGRPTFLRPLCRYALRGEYEGAPAKGLLLLRHHARRVNSTILGRTVVM